MECVVAWAKDGFTSRLAEFSSGYWQYCGGYRVMANTGRPTDYTEED